MMRSFHSIIVFVGVFLTSLSQAQEHYLRCRPQTPQSSNQIGLESLTLQFDDSGSQGRLSVLKLDGSSYEATVNHGKDHENDWFSPMTSSQGGLHIYVSPEPSDSGTNDDSDEARTAICFLMGRRDGQITTIGTSVLDCHKESKFRR